MCSCPLILPRPDTWRKITHRDKRLASSPWATRTAELAVAAAELDLGAGGWCKSGGGVELVGDKHRVSVGLQSVLVQAGSAESSVGARCALDLSGCDHLAVHFIREVHLDSLGQFAGGQHCNIHAGFSWQPAAIRSAVAAREQASLCLVGLAYGWALAPRRLAARQRSTRAAMRDSWDWCRVIESQSDLASASTDAGALATAYRIRCRANTALSSTRIPTTCCLVKRLSCTGCDRLERGFCKLRLETSWQ